MKFLDSGRRVFLSRSLPALTAATAATAAGLFCRPVAASPSVIRTRVEWQDFRRSNHYAPFIAALEKMRANTNAKDPASLNYWANIHANYCPHGIAYFLAWHRGLLYLFEQCLQTITGNPDLMVPYWDYYKHPSLPTEFITPSVNNPLYRERLSTNLYNALSMGPFRAPLVNFPRGMPNAFESQLEYKPHGPIHNLIGKLMASPQAPADPIFWVHHAQIDRLWCAWIAAGDGRRMPARTDPYWQGSLRYGETLTMDLARVIETRNTLGYRYADETMPTIPPPAQLAYFGPSHRVKTRVASDNVLREKGPGKGPSSGRILRASHEMQISPLIARCRNIVLHSDALQIEIPISAKDWRLLRAIAMQAQAMPFNMAGSRRSALPYYSARVVLDQVSVLGQAADGGYFYDIYLNGQHEPQQKCHAQHCLLGGFGPFEISGRRHHEGPYPRLAFAATPPLLAMTADAPRYVILTFVRINAEHAPQGPAIRVAELRLEFCAETE